MGSFGIGGVGLDVDFLVQQILFVERGPIRLLEQQDARFNAQAAAFRNISDKLLTLVDAINALKDFTGTFNSKLATSSDTSILTAFADASAQVGTHLINVSQLATNSIAISNNIVGSSSSTIFSTGLVDDTPLLGGRTLTVSDGTNPDISFTTALNQFTLADSSGGSLNPFTKNFTSGKLELSTAAGGSFVVEAADGTQLTVVTNTIQTGGTDVTLTIEQDEEKAREAVDEFVAAYNAVIQAINTQFTFNPATEQGGALAGDSSLRFVQSRILKDAVFSISGNNGIVNLATIGIDIADDGTLSVNSTELENALASNFEDVQTLITSFADNFSTDLDNLTDSIDGPLNIALKGISRNQSDIAADTIAGFEARLELRQQSLIEKFIRIDTLLRQLPVLLAQVNNQLGALS